MRVGMRRNYLVLLTIKQQQQQQILHINATTTVSATNAAQPIS